MRLGKLTNADLKSMVFDKINAKRNEVIVRPGVGEDCAVIDFADTVCVASTDPITAASSDIGALSVHVSCNDVASSGAEPVALLITLLIPPHAEAHEVEKITRDIADTADSLNVDIVGGHTEVTDAVNRIIVSAVVLGKAGKGSFVKSSGAKEGDVIIMTKYAAIEGTVIIANDYEDRLKEFLSDDEINQAKALGKSFSVVKEGLAAASFGISAMHDITEGGVIGAVHEICSASACGAVIDLDRVPLLPVTKKICEKFHLDPYRLISSGSMIMTVKDGEGLIHALNKAGIRAAVIGLIKKNGVKALANGIEQSAEPPLSDEIYKLLRRITL
jgi:hydrogenase maturation factor